MTDGKNDEQMARELMAVYLVNHYKRVQGVVSQKLEHARTATKKSAAGEAASYQALDAVWADIIALFRSSGLSTADMQKIEDVLGIIPATIKNHYDALVQDDPALRAGIATLASAEYRDAFAQAQSVAKKLNIDIDFALDENDRIVPAQKDSKITRAADKAYIIFRDGRKR